MDGKHDQTFMGILQEEGQVIPFLDSLFGFLYRGTDFFRLQNEQSTKLGFPPGVAEQIVLKVLRKWETKARQDEEKYYRLRNSSADEEPNCIREEVVETEPSESDQDAKTESSCSIVETEKKWTKEPSTSDSYNGAVRKGYQWSQTISDLDVQVTVPTFVTKAKHLDVNIDAERLCVKLCGVPEEYVTEYPEKTALLEGDLCYKTKKEESTWTLIPGHEVQIHLEKCQERWWDALLTSEEKINLQNIDASRPMDDLRQEEQMKIQELMWAEQRKRMGQLDPRHQPVADILKKAWNQEGSPFKGMEYNPSMINFDGNFMPDQDMPS
ncbi:nudC domain-containing protein 3 isoform X2 [Ischnura elegans]|uniref:nudC domain-containing protein 3 isoform X2 n=1 Tax=Ischnura elegans TaxID=197161 RepID=UPI001ED8B4FE|nr:nudC domain-containing protein 3 isoform X2 [Ischnura elegans]